MITKKTLLLLYCNNFLLFHLTKSNNYLPLTFFYVVAFDTPTGMPYGTVNLRYGVPLSETPITCTAGCGTFIIEFGTISALTGTCLVICNCFN